MGTGCVIGKTYPVTIVPQIRSAIITPTREGSASASVTGKYISYLQMHPATISWKKILIDDDTIPNNAVLATFGRNGEKIYYGRGMHNRVVVGGTVVPSEHRLYYSYNNVVHVMSVFEVLVRIALE